MRKNKEDNPILIKLDKRFRFRFERVWNPVDNRYYRLIAFGFIRIAYYLNHYVPNFKKDLKKLKKGETIE